MKTCFIISSIGSTESEVRKNSDLKLKYVFEPILNRLNYECIRADKEDIPGSISRKIVERIIQSELVICDISTENPNVFYELAIRNAVNKPVIIIKTPKQQPPFDIQDTRAISLDMTRPEIWQPALKQIENQISICEKDGEQSSRSILSDFSFQVDPDKEFSAEAEMKIQLKDIAEEVRSLRKVRSFNQQRSLPNFQDQEREKILSYSVAIDIKMPGFKKREFIVVTPELTMQNILDQIYFNIEQFVEPYHYLDTWVLEDTVTKKKLIMNEISYLVPAHFVFFPTSRWTAIPLKKPYKGSDSNGSFHNNKKLSFDN